ncbi:hypothetical protein XH98_39290 [Bradyrhizobium sp. CCBAU 51745]|nr:hypothetical protein [Bradyrhizobium sp. CCBAU 45384]MDA9445001.1 hypothetical protein [Bradyrhizobium sp. CCBAU 51745]
MTHVNPFLVLGSRLGQSSMPGATELMMIRLRMVMHMGWGARTCASPETSCDAEVAGQRTMREDEPPVV